MTRMRLNFLLRAAVLLCLALGAVWLSSRPPSERGKSSNAPITDLSNPAVDSSAESSQTPTLKRKLPTHVAAEAPALSAEPPDDPDDAREWARQNPKDASAWLLNASAGPKRDTIAEMVCAQVAETEPAQAVASAEKTTGGS